MSILYPILVAVILYFAAVIFAPLIPVFLILLFLVELLGRKKR